MEADALIKQSLEHLVSHYTDETELNIDLGLNWWGQGKLGLIVEMYLTTAGYRSLTDQEIKSWKTIGDIAKTIEEAKKTRIKERRGPKRADKKSG